MTSRVRYPADMGDGMSTSKVVLAVAAAAVLVTLAHASAQPQRAGSSKETNVSLPPGNIEHGRYLAEHVAMCVECHSGRDADGNIIQREKYLGGSLPFAPPFPDWAMRVPRNRGLVGYDDKAALRLLTQGAIGRDGYQLRPPMPRFRMTPQDAADVIAFLRSAN
jgi:hypothetical protein